MSPSANQPGSGHDASAAESPAALSPSEGLPTVKAPDTSFLMQLFVYPLAIVCAIAIVVAWCLQIIAPFVGIVIWGLIIAIALQSPYDALSRKIGNRKNIAATIMVLLGINLVNQRSKGFQ